MGEGDTPSDAQDLAIPVTTHRDGGLDSLRLLHQQPERVASAAPVVTVDWTRLAG